MDRLCIQAKPVTLLTEHWITGLLLWSKHAQGKDVQDEPFVHIALLAYLGGYIAHLGWCDMTIAVD